MIKVYITFGQIHSHIVNNKKLNKDTVGIIEANDYEQGRNLAFDWFKGKFHCCILESDWNDEDMTYYPDGYVNINF